jgi:hypothetical protein
MKRIIFIVIVIALASNVFGQRFCGSQLDYAEMQKTDPMRYQRFMGIEKLSVFAEGSIDIGNSSSKETSESITKEVQSATVLGVNVFPLISYDLTDRYSIIATCDFLRLGLIL